MRNVLTGTLGLVFFVCGTLALAAAGEGGQLAPEPTVSVGWVYFFLFVFVAICAWFGFAIWRSDRKSTAGADGSQQAKN
jgi:membrane-bound ClpP family serine protease